MDDMSDVLNKFSDILKEKNIDLNEVLNNFSTDNQKNVDNSSSDNSKTNSFGELDFETILKLKKAMDKINSSNNSNRTNLLMSLKPYLKESRKEKLDQCIKLANMSSLIELFKSDK